MILVQLKVQQAIMLFGFSKYWRRFEVVKGKVDFFRYVDGNGVIQVSGNTYCNLTAGNWFRLADYNIVNLDFYNQ